MNEIIRCKICREEYELIYEGDEVVSETKCSCRKKDRVNIDYAFKLLNQELLNEKPFAGTRKISIPVKARK